MPPKLAFQPSTEPTIGAEIELQILDRDTGELATGGLRLLSACNDAGMEGVEGEFLTCMIEVKSDVCRNVAELRDNLVPRLRQVRNIALTLGYDLAMGGTHPFAKPTAAAVWPDERHQRIMDRQGWIAYQEAIFGLHVHIGVPDGDAAIGVINHCVQYLPHLLALSANSPFWQGVDSGHLSTRTRMFHPNANAGLPVHFRGWSAYGDYCQCMHQAGLIEDTTDVFWDIRPQPALGTVEFRIFDVPCTLSAALGLAALTRSLVVRQLRSANLLEPVDPPEFWQANENKWLAARYGLEAQCVRTRGGKRNRVADDIRSLIAEVTPIAVELGDAEFLHAVHPDQDLEIGADRQRQLFQQAGDWHTVLDDLRTHWVQELDANLSTCIAGVSAPASSL